MVKAMRSVRSTTALVLVTFLAGCAFGTRQATLVYPPAPESGQIPVAHAAVAPHSKNIKVVVFPFSDMRADKNVVGTVRNGLGMRTADVVAVNSVLDWVSLGLRTELLINGYTPRIGTPEDSAATPDPVISGDVLNMFSDMYLNYSGEVSLAARVNKGGKELLSKQYKGEGSAGIVWGATAESFAQTLALALSSAIKKLVADLDAMLTAR